MNAKSDVLQKRAFALRSLRPERVRNYVNRPQLPIQTLDATEVATLLRAGKLLLIDVREPAAFQAERIAGALLYPLSTFHAAAILR